MLMSKNVNNDVSKDSPIVASIKQLGQPRRQRQQERHKYAYLTMKNSSSFARFARAFFIFVHFGAVLVLSTT